MIDNSSLTEEELSLIVDDKYTIDEWQVLGYSEEKGIIKGLVTKLK